MNLNQLKSRIAKIEASGKTNSICVGTSTYLQVKGKESKSWIFRYRFGGKAKMMGMGAYDTLTMTEAQAKAHELRKQVTAGIDPKAARDAAEDKATADAAASVTLSYAINRFLAPADPKKDPDAGDALAAFSNTKHKNQWRSTLASDSLKDLRKLPCSKIETTDIAKALRPIWHKRKTAMRLRGRLQRVLNYATVMNWRKGPNPALRELVSELLPKDKVVTKNHVALDWERVPKFMARLRKRPDKVARCLELIILTASRRKEIHGLKFSEFDPVKKTVTIPASRMKKRKQHIVPLSQRAIDIIKERRTLTNGDLVFEGEAEGKPFGASAMTTLLESFHKLAKVVNEVTDEVTLETITIHGFRSSFSGWAAETGQHPEAKEHCLAHRKAGVQGVYERVTFLDRRAHIMTAWADFCERSAADNVSRLHAAA